MNTDNTTTDNLEISVEFPKPPVVVILEIILSYPELVTGIHLERLLKRFDDDFRVYVDDFVPLLIEARRRDALEFLLGAGIPIRKYHVIETSNSGESAKYLHEELGLVLNVV